MKILLISGFLGAGKTTFIKELIKKTKVKAVIMENEYGDNNLDSIELQQASEQQKKDIKVLEFMEGCVCCSMKDSFINSVLTIFSSLGPEYLIIEPTGVGRLSNIIDNLKPLLNSAVMLLKPVVVISPDAFAHNMREWQVLYEDQIRNAQIVVFSKCENTSSEVISDVARKVKELNPQAEIINNHYSGKDVEWWNHLLDIRADDKESAGEGASDKDVSFSQISVDTAGVHNIGELVVFLEDCLHGVFGHVARAKGTLWVDNEYMRFDLAERLYAITGAEDDHCQCVVIGQYLDERKIKERLCPGSGRTLVKRQGNIV